MAVLRVDFDAEGEVLGRLPQAAAQARIRLLAESGEVLRERTSTRTGAPWREEFAELQPGLVQLRVQFYDGSGSLLGSAERSVSLGAGLTVSVDINTMATDQEPPPQPPEEAKRLRFLVQPQAVQVGQSFAVEVAAVDANGQRVFAAEGEVRLRLEGAPLGGADPETLDEGLAAWSGLMVSQAGTDLVLVAECDGLASARSLVFTVGAAEPPAPERVPTSLDFASVPGDAVVAGDTFLVKVEVRDQFGDRLQGDRSSLRLTLAGDPAPPAGATFTPMTVRAEDGVGMFAISLNKSGPYRLSVASTGLGGAASSTIAVVPGQAQALEFIEAPQGGTARVTLPPVTVAINDAHGNRVSASQAPISLAKEEGGAAKLSGTLRRETVEGSAIFSDLALDRANGGTRLIASSPGLQSVTSNSFDVAPATGYSLGFLTMPSANLTAGVSPSGMDAVVEVRDESGERSLDFDGTIWLQLKAENGFVPAVGAGGPVPTLSGASVEAVDGVASFSDFSTNFIGAYAIEANASGIASVLPEASFSVTHGPPHHLVLTAQPTGGEIAVRLEGSTSAQVRDAHNNLCTNFPQGASVDFDVVDSPSGLTNMFFAIGYGGGSWHFGGGPVGLWGMPSGYYTIEASYPDVAPIRTASFFVGQWRELMVSEGSFASGGAPDSMERRVGQDSDGNFAVVSNNTLNINAAPPPYPIQVRLYDAAGVPRGNPIVVGTGASANIAMSPSGDFVVAYLKGSASRKVYALRFDSAGNPQGAEFSVSAGDGASQPSVSINDAGEFAVVWQGRHLVNSAVEYDIFARRFNADGSAQAAEYGVNTMTSGTQQDPAVALGDSGEMMVTWRSDQVRGQVYNSSDAAVGGEIVIGNPAYTQQFSSVAVDGAGRFVVAWQSLNQDGSGFAVYARRYDATALPLESEFRVNTYTSGNQSSPCVDTDASGNFVVVWNSTGAQDGSDFGVYLQRYDSNAARQGVETLVNTTTNGFQGRAAVAVSSPSSFVVAWRGMGFTGQRSPEPVGGGGTPVVGEGILARRFIKP